MRWLKDCFGSPHSPLTLIKLNFIYFFFHLVLHLAATDFLSNKTPLAGSPLSAADYALIAQ